MQITKFFTKEEIRDLVISTLVISTIFSFHNFQHFPVYLAVVVMAFVFHELAHKFVAIKFNCAAFYKMWPPGLLFGFLFMFFGVKIIAPGAVVIRPYKFGRWGFRVSRLTVPEIGLISLSGPLVNLFFAILFYPFKSLSFFSEVNAWLAFFNLLPIPPLDGSKIIQWKPWLWIFVTIISFILVFRIF
ncbi:MAG: site-2 protease family protein [Candidatus Aenigmatarchaeota archaeon]